MGNVDTISDLAIVDGMRFTWPYVGSDEHQRRYHRVVHALVGETGMTDAEVRSYLKYAPVKSGKTEGGKLSVLFIGGKLARYLPAAYIDANIRFLTELHVKVWLVDAHSNAHNGLIDEVYHAKAGRYKPTVYGPGHGRGRNQPGAKGLTFGTDKAGIHVTLNRYRDCRTHIEGHVQGAILRSIIDDVTRRQTANAVAGTISEVFPAVQYEASYRTIERVLVALRSRGVRLTDHFGSVSDVSWIRPLYSDNRIPLSDTEEKATAIVAHSKEEPYPDVDQYPLDLE